MSHRGRGFGPWCTLDNEGGPAFSVVAWGRKGIRTGVMGMLLLCTTEKQKRPADGNASLYLIPISRMPSNMCAFTRKRHQRGWSNGHDGRGGAQVRTVCGVWRHRQGVIQRDIEESMHANAPTTFSPVQPSAFPPLPVPQPVCFQQETVSLPRCSPCGSQHHLRLWLFSNSFWSRICSALSSAFL